MLKRKQPGAAAIRAIAARHGVPADEVARDIQAAIDAAWASENAALRGLFPGGKPTPAEFIGRLAVEVSTKTKEENKG